MSDSLIIQTTDQSLLVSLLINIQILENILTMFPQKKSKSVGVLYRLNSSLPPDILKILYNGLILPYITYGIETWYGAPRYMST